MRFLPVGPRTFLIELADLASTLALLDALTSDPVEGVEEIVPAARTLMIRTAPGVAADAVLAGAIEMRRNQSGLDHSAIYAETVDIPVCYEGEDMPEVARHMGLSVAEVIEAHQAATWQVAFCGFAPGFAYLSGSDPRFNLPRRSSPRTRIPAGSVALAARFSGIYPRDTPGGWQLIGTTPEPMWDLSREPPALLRPGMRVRFVAHRGLAKRKKPAHAARDLPPPIQPPALTLLASVFPVLFQDEGRPGQAGQGVSASGALDVPALRGANRAVGNPADAAALELTLGPVQFRAESAVTLALTGAGRAVVAGRTMAAGSPFALDPGDVVTVDPPATGMRSYLALRGCFAVEPVLGSCATDTLAAIGPLALNVGDVVRAAGRPASAVAPADPVPDLPRPGDLVTLPVTLGPRADWFAAEMLERFLTQEWEVTPQSSRVGIRLQGVQALTRDDSRELPSEGTELGAIQVPHSGQPVIFLADHPLTGGYPVIATLLPEAIPRAGQIPPGARIRFAAVAPFAPLTLAMPQ